VAEPPSDDIHLNAAFEEMNRRRVAKHMWRNPPLFAFAFIRVQALRVTTHDFINAEAREWLIPARQGLVISIGG
jgi:hypothetical protein